MRRISILAALLLQTFYSPAIAQVTTPGMQSMFGGGNKPLEQFMRAIGGASNPSELGAQFPQSLGVIMGGLQSSLNATSGLNSSGLGSALSPESSNNPNQQYLQALVTSLQNIRPRNPEITTSGAPVGNLNSQNSQQVGAKLGEVFGGIIQGARSSGGRQFLNIPNN
jgi:hypothetical protein